MLIYIGWAGRRIATVRIVPAPSMTRNISCSSVNAGVAFARDWWPASVGLLSCRDVRYMYCGRLSNFVPEWSDNTMAGAVRVLFISMVNFVLTQKPKDKRWWEREVELGAVPTLILQSFA